MLSAPLIKYIRFKVINSGSELSVLQSGEVHFAEPPAQTTVINQIAGTNFSGILVDALGYGYIGINSALIPDIYARRAITSAFNTDLALEYYTNGLATIIHRPMSRVSWAYPRNADNMYPFDETGETSKALFLQSDSFIEEDGNVVYADGSKVTYTFSLPMDIADHPTGQIFLEAKKVLEKIGVEVTVEEDYYLTDKLQDDVVSVWAAAWQAEIDPDKFQVYYSDPEVNTAGSPKQFGLYHMFENGTDEEKKLLDNINELIIQGRESLNTDERKPVYEQMLNLIMELCVEIPVYQRNDMFVYNSGVIDGETLWGNVTPYKNPLSEIWDVSLVLE
jgi:peptide/nickel transport system substrate-binding protein